MLGDRGAAAPRAQTKRATMINAHVDANPATSTALTTYSVIPANSGEAPPEAVGAQVRHHGPIAMPKKNAVMLQPTWVESAGIPNSAGACRGTPGA